MERKAIYHIDQSGNHYPVLIVRLKQEGKIVSKICIPLPQSPTILER